MDNERVTPCYISLRSQNYNFLVHKMFLVNCQTCFETSGLSIFNKKTYEIPTFSIMLILIE